MKIHYIGLSSFMIENKAGFRILLDPFNNAPEWSLGPKFPEQFQGQPFGANIVLMSEPDADHAYAPGDWLEKAPPTKPNSNPFPNLNLRGTVVYECNGDLNIAYNFTVDGIRFAHFADNAHLLTEEQLTELGELDVVFMSPPKPDTTADSTSLKVVRQNLAALNPKIVIWSHHLAPKGLPDSEDSTVLRPFFVEYFKTHAHTSKFYNDDKSFMELCYVLENGFKLNKDYTAIVQDETSLEIDDALLHHGTDSPVTVLFRAMLAD